MLGDGVYRCHFSIDILYSDVVKLFMNLQTPIILKIVEYFIPM